MTASAFESIRQAIQAATPTTLPTILGQLEEARAAAWARLLAPQQLPNPQRPERERLLTPLEAAAIAQVPAKRIYSWARGRRWAIRPSRKCLRISETAFRRWLESRVG